MHLFVEVGKISVQPACQDLVGKSNYTIKFYERL